MRFPCGSRGTIDSSSAAHGVAGWLSFPLGAFDGLISLRVAVVSPAHYDWLLMAWRQLAMLTALGAYHGLSYNHLHPGVCTEDIRSLDSRSRSSWCFAGRSLEKDPPRNPPSPRTPPPSNAPTAPHQR